MTGLPFLESDAAALATITGKAFSSRIWRASSDERRKESSDIPY